MSHTTSMTISAAWLPSPVATPWPVLESGDVMSRAEFERRYASMPSAKKAELINEVVDMPSPVSLLHHAQPHGELMTWLGCYRASTPAVILGDNASVRLDPVNEPQPDAVLLWDTDHGGQTRVDSDGFLEGPPEFVAEVSASSVSIDLHAKLHVYWQACVREYLVWRVHDRAIDWFEWREDGFQRIPSAADGSIESRVFPGLCLAPPTLIDGDMARVLQLLRTALERR